MKFIIDLIFGLIFCLSLGGLGGYFAQRMLNIKTNFFTAFFFGCGLAIVILFITGLLGLFSSIFFLIFIILICLFVVSGKRSFAKWSPGLNKKTLVPIALALVMLILAGLAALSPPIKNDTLYYHLGLPKLWAADSGINFYPTIALSATALNGELLLTPIVARISPEAAQFFVFLIAFMAMILFAEELKRFTGAARCFGFLFLAAMPLYAAGLADAKNDYLAAGFCLISAFFYFDYLKIKQAKYLILSGVFAGLAAGAKSNALIFMFALTIAIIIGRPRLKDFLLYLIGATVFGLPWYLKAYLATGNPFYPFYSNIFQSAFWPNTFDGFNRATMPVSENRSILNFILSPFKLVYWPDLFRGRIGPLPLIFLPLLLLIRNHPRVVKQSLWITAIFYVVWFAVWANARYLLPAVLLLVFASAYIAYRVAAKTRAVWVTVMIVICLLIGVNIAQITRDDIPRIKAAAGLIERDSFLREATALDPNKLSSGAREPALPYYEIWQYANTALPQNALIGILCSNWNRADGFYLDRRFLYLNPTEQKVVDFTLDPEGLLKSLQISGIDYILLDKQVFAEFTSGSPFSQVPGFAKIAAGVQAIANYTNKNGRLEYQTDRYELYSLK